MLRAVQRHCQLPLRSAFAPAISTPQTAGTMTTDTPQQQDGQQQTSPFYSLSAKTIQDTELPFSELKGKVVLLVNTASKCGFTPQVRWARSVIPATFLRALCQHQLCKHDCQVQSLAPSASPECTLVRRPCAETNLRPVAPAWLQYQGLQQLHDKYKDQGLVILGFPCDQCKGTAYETSTS